VEPIEECDDSLIDEVGAIVGIDDEGHRMLGKEGTEETDHGRTGGAPARHGRQDIAGGEIPDDEEVGVDAVDGVIGMGEVHGPDGARAGPAQAAGMAVQAMLGDPEQAGELAPGKIREVVFQIALRAAAVPEREEIRDLASLGR